MKGLFPAVLLFLGTLSPVFGDAVMVLTQKPDHFEGEADISRLAAFVENGLMDTLFDEGHIVFGDQEVKSPLTTLWNPQELQDELNQSGADFLLVLRLVPTSGKELPQIFYHLSGTKGESWSGSVLLEGGASLDEQCYSKGKSLAQEVLSRF